MKLNKFTVILAILLISIMAIGAVSAESVDDSDAIAIDEDIGDVQESIEPADVAEDLSTADAVDDAIATDTADEIVNEESGAVLGDDPVSYDLDDNTYSILFNEDGTATDEISTRSNYTLNVGTLNNKDIKINYGSHINIVGKEGAGFINNGTIYLDGGADGNVGSVTISGLTFTNTNKGAIDIAEYCTDINIIGNNINAVGDLSAYSGSSLTVTAIAPHNFIYGLYIIDNKITVTGDANYTNGIWAMNWAAVDSPSNFHISGNTIYVDGSNPAGSHAALFVECCDSVIDNNNITTKSVGDACAYGIQVPDSVYLSYAYGYPSVAKSPSNFNITNNNIRIDTENMAYGITYLSYGADGTTDSETYMPTTAAFPLNVFICDNNVVINSKKGAIGIGGQCYNMTVTGNNLTVIAGSPEGVKTADSLGAYSTVFLVMYDDLNEYYDEDADDYIHLNDYKIFIEDNYAITNVTGELITDTDYLEYVPFDNRIIKFQNDEGNFIVYDQTFDLFFDENGNLKGIIPEGSTIKVGDLHNKKLNINIPLTIESMDGEMTPLENTVINLVEGADGTVIDGVYFNFRGDETTGSIGIIYAKAVDNITIKNNVINVPQFVDKTGAKYGSSVYAIELESGATGCNKAVIRGNQILIQGSARYLYGIDVFKTYGAENKNDDLTIIENIVTIYGGANMAEPIYVSDSKHVLLLSNILKSSSSGSAYGIGTDGLEEATFFGNNITAISDAMAYAITATNANDLLFQGNNIYSTGSGAVGIGLMNDNGATINSNTITINGGDYITAPTKDSLGTANAAILNKSGNENINIYENDITENVPIFISNDNYDTYFNADGTIKDDAPFQNDDHVVFDKLTGKTVVIDMPLEIEGTAVDTQIIVISGAEGARIYSLDMEATVSSGSFAFIYVKEVNGVSIVQNNLVINCNNDLSTWDMIMPIEVESGATGCNGIYIAYNNITVTGAAPYVYGIDVFQTWGSQAPVNQLNIVYNNITLDVDSSMTEGIYLSGVNNSQVACNNIKSRSSTSAYGIGTDRLTQVAFGANNITVNAGGMAYGITATMSGKEIGMYENNIDVTGTGAMGIGLAGQDTVVIKSNNIAIDGGDYTTLTPLDVLGVGNAAIFEGDGNTNVTSSGNKISEFTEVKLDCSDLTVTAAPSGQGAFEVTLKTLDGKALANKEITFSFNNQVIKATTDENGIAKLSFDLKKGKYPVSVAFLGDKQYKGALETATITIDPIKTSLTSVAKTYLATAKTKSLTATLKDANGKALAGKKVTFTVNGKTVTATTDAKGVATAKLALTAAKTYTVSIKFAGDNVYAASTVSAKVKLNKEKTKVTAPKKTFKKSKKVKKVTVTLKNSKGKAIAKKKLTLTVNKKKFTAKTNKKGKATFKVKMLTKKGTKKYTVKFAGDSQYKACKKTGKIKIK